MDLTERLKIARKAARLSQGEVAAHFNVSTQAVSQWETGRAAPARERLSAIAELYRVRLEWLLDGEEPRDRSHTDLSPGSPATISDSITKPRAPSVADPQWRNEVSREGVPTLPALEGLPLDLPVYGAAEGGNGDADFALNGKVRERVRRPPGLMGVEDAFAVYVFGDSMLPRFEPGELVYVHPGKPPTQGRYVLVELFNSTVEEHAGPALVKRFVSMSDERLVVEQLNPPKTIRIARNRVKGVFCILRSDEFFRS